MQHDRRLNDRHFYIPLHGRSRGSALPCGECLITGISWHGTDLTEEVKKTCQRGRSCNYSSALLPSKITNDASALWNREYDQKETHHHTHVFAFYF
ncbi:hypothetical protein BV898_05392 [Hypsibius exemplaris]|uniref:Uncharacterized protein n=1 Tax=Hypsibius exemplaris TaxID=2072580 RepID=A0A1W0WZC6_HYPEX|nr:hypothetical protein BV898_05392 [Hypsibius exemplaris]